MVTIDKYQRTFPAGHALNINVVFKRTERRQQKRRNFVSYVRDKLLAYDYYKQHITPISGSQSVMRAASSSLYAGAPLEAIFLRIVGGYLIQFCLWSLFEQEACCM